MSYSGNTVAQLKELLKQRDLPTDGLKADLIGRLEEYDAKNGAPNGSDDQEPSVEAPTKPEQADGSTTAETEKTEPEPKSVSAEETESKQDAQETEAPAKPELSPEQLKQAAIDHLQKKIHRAEKFGQDDAVVNDLQRQINRIEKFGLDLTTQLAQELGFGKGPVASVGKSDRHFKSKFKNKNKNRK